MTKSPSKTKKAIEPNQENEVKLIRRETLHGVTVAIRSINGEETFGTGGFISDERPEIEAAMNMALRISVENRQRENESLETTIQARAKQKLAAQANKRSREILKANAIEQIKEKIGSRKQLTYKQFDAIVTASQSTTASITIRDARSHFKDQGEIDLTRK